ncbi:unnamed protein product, partial [Nesidiocoris tenuis]
PLAFTSQLLPDYWSKPLLLHRENQYRTTRFASKTISSSAVEKKNEKKKIFILKTRNQPHQLLDRKDSRTKHPATVNIGKAEGSGRKDFVGSGWSLSGWAASRCSGRVTPHVLWRGCRPHYPPSTGAMIHNKNYRRARTASEMIRMSPWIRKQNRYNEKDSHLPAVKYLQSHSPNILGRSCIVPIVLFHYNILNQCKQMTLPHTRLICAIYMDLHQ